jgi:hypothetical protein
MRWEYTGLDGQIHGPYSSSEMAEWIRQGFFTGDSAVYMREYRPHRTAAKELENDFEDSDGDGEEESKGPNSTQQSSHPAVSAFSSDWILSDHIDFSALQDNTAPETEKTRRLLSNGTPGSGGATEDESGEVGRKRRRKEVKEEEDSGDD